MSIINAAANKGRHLDPADRRDQSIKIRVTAGELAIIESRADDCGVNVARYMRAAATTDDRILDAGAIVRELSPIGVSLNQIAQRVNGESAADLAAALAELRALMQRIGAQMRADNAG